MCRAATATLAAVVARGTSVERPRENRQPRRDAGDVQLLRRFLDQELVAPRLRRRLEDAVGLVREVLQVLAEDADELIDLVVIRLQVLIADRPVVAETVERLAHEIVRPEPQRDAAPVIGSPAEHARAKPVELVARSIGVRLAVERPAAER